MGKIWNAIRGLFGLKPKHPSGYDAVENDGQDPPSEPKETCEVRDRAGKVVRYECGHDFQAAFAIDLYGEPFILKKDNGVRKLCGACTVAKILADSIRCGLCGFGILPGHSVALYCDDRKLFKKKEWKTLVDGQVVGCMRWDCCPSGGFFAGHWTLQGFRPAFAHGSAAAEVFATGKAIIIGDSSDPSTIKKID